MSGECYKCKHRGTIPGDAHSCCNHPEARKATGGDVDVFSGIVAMFSNPKGIIEAALKLNIQANPHGICSGWFNWPANFDPVWLENCDGFEEK